MYKSKLRVGPIQGRIQKFRGVPVGAIKVPSDVAPVQPRPEYCRTRASSPQVMSPHGNLAPSNVTQCILAPSKVVPLIE